MRRLAFTLILALPRALRAQSAGSATIHGLVRGDQGAPIAGAVVDVLSVGRVRTDSAGAYHVGSLPAGTLIVRATMIGFQPVLKIVTIATGADIQLDLAMFRATQQLPTVVVKEDSSFSPLLDPSGFDARRTKSVGGRFITADEIERTHTFDMRTLFYDIPGIQVDTSGIVVMKHGEISLRDSYLTGKAVNQFNMCLGAQVFVDGFLMPQPFDINTIPVFAVRGIEIYDGPATTPVELRSSKTVCGTIAIWTKRK